MSAYDLDRLTVELPDLLEDLAAPGKPAYADALFERLERAPQRPRWRFASRWLPETLAQARVPAAPVASWRAIVLALAVLALVVAGLIIVGSRPKVPPPFGLATPGDIAYVAGGQIWLARPDGSGGRPISEGGVDLHPAFSPDGTKLAFVRLAPPGSHLNWQEWGTVIVADADGGHQVEIDTDQSGISPFSWSADGRQLIYSRGVGSAEQLVAAAIDGSGIRQLTTGADGSWGPVLAPDGQHVAYIRNRPSSLELRVLDLDGGADRLLASLVMVRVDIPNWSPDSRTIVYGVGEPGNLEANLWQLDVETGVGSAFVVAPGNQQGPAWSPDGTGVAYVDDTIVDHGVIRVARANGSSPRTISDGGTWTYPSWAPDGRHVVATAQGAGQLPALVILDADGIEPPLRIVLPDAAGPGRGDLPAWQRLAP